MLRGWHGWFGTVNGVVVLTVAALPLAALAVWTLARVRSVRGRDAPGGNGPAGDGRSAWRRSLAEVGIVYGTLPWVWMILLPNRGAGQQRVNLVPLRDLVTVVAGGPLTATVQIAGNLLVFAAFGFFAPMRFVVSVPRILAFAAAGSVTVETLQYVLPLDRVSSVDDVLLNAAGAGLAALASRRWWRGSTERDISLRGSGAGA
ncbi:VanZ family protein [Actinoplanes sp. CA-142083]|uniref:VanZ family protein n=1 Tax=Actinoplanes sp. CA-142083 TaxID=3239903 RepID=UPI003D91F8AA